MTLIINLVLGICLGYILHRSRFCIAGAFRDYILFKDRSLLKALLVSLFISSVTFSLFQFVSWINGLPIPGHFHAIGYYTVIGGILFGIGMVLAGGCACSIFIRLGEGFKLVIFVLLGVMAGSLVGAYQNPWWETNFTWVEKVFLGDLIWWPGALFLQLGILAAGWRYLKYQEEKEKEKKNNVSL